MNRDMNRIESLRMALLSLPVLAAESPRRRRGFVPGVDGLELRIELSTFTVTTDSNDPNIQGSLPYEVAAATGPFDLIVFSKPFTVQEAQPLDFTQGVADRLDLDGGTIIGPWPASHQCWQCHHTERHCQGYRFAGNCG